MHGYIDTCHYFAPSLRLCEGLVVNDLGSSPLCL